MEDIMATYGATDTENRMNKATGAAKDAAQSFGEGASNARDDLSKIPATIGQEVKAQMGQLGAVGQEQAQKLLTAASTQVRSHPATTLGIAAGVGLIFGMMLAGRR
jgi:ElaB/YqjD/DUF883 family membrane-anchored ribosome-binding protein